MVRRLAPLLSVLVLTGCGFYTGTEKATQPTGIGKLRFTVTFCGIDATPGSGDATTAQDGTITEPGNPCGQTSGNGSAARYQGLIALRFPVGVTLPDTLTGADGSVAVRSPTYTASFGTPPAGTQIQGYITPAKDFGLGDASKTDYSTTFDVPLPPAAAGQPFTGPLKARVLSGYRTITPITGKDTDPVDCSASTTTCVSSKQPAADLAFPTRDLAIGTPATSQTAVATFPLRFAGAAGPTFDLSAATTVPAASVAPAHTTFTPTADQTADEPVTVTVPLGTDPGVYDVTLTAKLGDETRSATGKITVAAPVVATVSPTATPVKTVAPTVTPVKTTVPVATPTPVVKTPKRAPKAFTLSVKKAGARSLKARGRLKLPAGVVRADGCNGIVRLTVGKIKKTTILTGGCSFSRTLKVKEAGTYTVKATFTGNQFLTAKPAKSRRFKVS